METDVPLTESKGPKKPRTVPPVKVFDMLPRLIEAVRWGQQQRFEELVGQMATMVDESRPELAQALRQYGTNTLKPLHMDMPGAKFAQLERPQRPLQSVILPDPLLGDIDRFLQEHSKRGELERFALVPRHRILLHGPPGNGKTLLAEGLSTALEIPLLRARYGMIVDSHLGETNKNLAHLLEYAASGPCVLFFDEFDSIATKRGLQNDVGELRRVTNWLLIHMERLNPQVIFIAATNTKDQVDDAVIRRFDTQWSLPAPTKELREKCACQELAPEITGGKNLMPFAQRVAELDIANLNAVVEVCRQIRRDYALNDGRNVETLLRVT